MITKDNVKELFDYKDGNLYWKKTGKKAGCATQYVRVGYQKKKYLAHRIIWLWHNGEWPDVCDHIDQNPLNNRIENLRSVTKAENNLNNKAAGVAFDKRSGGYWSATYRGIHYGTYKTKTAALARRAQLELADPAHLRTAL